MRNIWDKYIISKYFFTFSWITISAFFVYLSSDLLFKIQKFKENPEQIILFYSLRLIPFFIISMPVIAFFSQILLGIMIRRRKEWHIAKLICHSNFKLAKGIIYAGTFLLLIWIISRELILPNLRTPLNETYSQVKGKSLAENRLIKLEHKFYYIKNIQGDYQTIEVLNVDSQSNTLSKPQQLSWNQAQQAWSPQTYPHIPTPQELGARKRFYIYTPLTKILDLCKQSNYETKVTTALIERLLFAPLFIFYFFISSIDIIRCRHIKLVWTFPVFSLFAFTISIMAFKTISLDYGIIKGLIATLSLAIITPNLFNLYFKRSHKSNRVQ